MYIYHIVLFEIFSKNLSAGVPLTYYHFNSSSTSIENLTTKFLETPFTANTDYTYSKNGFLPNITLTEIFTNKYAQTSGDKLQIRAMNAEDIYGVTGLIEITYGITMKLNDVKYNKLFVNGAIYCLASACDSHYVWYVNTYGYVYASTYGNSVEYRHPSSCFFKP